MIGDSVFDRIARSKAFSTRSILLFSAAGGALSFLLFIFTFVAAHNFPPMKPYWSAEETAAFWRKHERGAHVGAGLQLCCGMLYIPFSALISHQIRKVPGIHPIVPATQLAACAAGIFTWMLGGMVLATVTYRLDRDPEITQALTDMWWFTTMMPWPTFMIQNFAWAYAVIKDTRPERPLPRYLAVLNILSPIIFVFPTAMHTTKSGALSWCGGVTFWSVGAMFGVQLFADSYFMMKLVWLEYGDLEEIVEPHQTTEKNSETDYSP